MIDPANTNRTKQLSSTYNNSVFLTFHGSWNRDVKTGYKVVRLWFNDSISSGPNVTVAGIEDFLSPNVTPPVHRPVDIKVGIRGEMYISSDASGAIFVVRANSTALPSDVTFFYPYQTPSSQSGFYKSFPFLYIVLCVLAIGQVGSFSFLSCFPCGAFP
jgi:hypothetical protein